MTAAPHPARTGILFLLSAPSGAGKSTLCNGLKATQDFVYSVSCTTRLPRPGEVNGRDYHFLSRDEFETRATADEFLEHAEVHGNRYGTLRETVLESLRRGIDVLMDIDTQGAAMVRANAHPEIRDALVDIFLMPPSLEVLRERLASRGTESGEETALRLRNAREEMREWSRYRYTILTGTVEETLADFRAIMRSERLLSRRLSFEL